MVRPIVFSDLDDTLFQTARKMQEAPDMGRLAAQATNGHHSYMTTGQDQFVQWLMTSAEVIPVTARSTEALSRCKLSFASWKIAANGAVLLARDGAPDSAWLDRTAQISRSADAALKALEGCLERTNRQDRLRYWIVTEFGMPIYFCAKSNGDEAWLSEARGLLDPIAGEAMNVHRNGNNLSYTPVGISKKDAVSELTTRIGEGRFLIGAGDSLTDLPFMTSCNMMMVPPGSQIAQSVRGDAGV